MRRRESSDVISWNTLAPCQGLPGKRRLLLPRLRHEHAVTSRHSRRCSHRHRTKPHGGQDAKCTYTLGQHSFLGRCPFLTPLQTCQHLSPLPSPNINQGPRPAPLSRPASGVVPGIGIRQDSPISAHIRLQYTTRSRSATRVHTV